MFAITLEMKKDNQINHSHSQSCVYCSWLDVIADLFSKNTVSFIDLGSRVNFSLQSASCAWSFFHPFCPEEEDWTPGHASSTELPDWHVAGRSPIRKVARRQSNISRKVSKQSNIQSVNENLESLSVNAVFQQQHFHSIFSQLIAPYWPK